MVRLSQFYYGLLAFVCIVMGGALAYAGAVSAPKDFLSYWSFDLAFIALGVSFIPMATDDAGNKLDGISEKIDQLTKDVSELRKEIERHHPK